MFNQNSGITNLTGLKAFLSIHLVLSHTFPSTLRSDIWGSILEHASVSTSMFIMLSGFFLSYFYMHKEIKLNVFIKKRLAKLYPFHFVMTIAAALLMYNTMIRGNFSGAIVDTNRFALGPVEYLISVVSQLFLIDSLNPFFLGINIPGWTLSSLFFCYLIFPILLKPIMSQSNLKSWLLVLAIVLFSNLFSTYLVYNGFDNENLILANTYSKEAMVYGLIHRFPLIRIFEFILGMLLARIASYSSTASSANLSIKYFLAAIISFSITLIFQPKNFIQFHNGAYFAFEVFLMMGLYYAPSLYVLRNSLVTKIALASFILYLLHMPFYLALLKFAKGLTMFVSNAKEYVVLNFDNIHQHIDEVSNVGDSIFFFFTYICLVVYTSISINQTYLPKLNNAISKVRWLPK